MLIAGLDLSVVSSGITILDLDSKFDIVSVKSYGFTTSKKMECDNIFYYNNKQFVNKYDKYIFMKNTIIDLCKDVDVVAIEDYNYNATGSIGRIFDLAECEGHIKLTLYEEGKVFRTYAIKQIKKFYAKNGNADKISMYNAFLADNMIKPDITNLPEVDNGKKGVGPTSDIIDSYAIARMLAFELKLKNGILQIVDQDKKVIEVFTNGTKVHPNGLIDADFEVR